jgi:hypothetical protein
VQGPGAKVAKREKVEEVVAGQELTCNSEHCEDYILPAWHVMTDKRGDSATLINP